MIGYGPGLVEEAGEEAMIAAFGDESLNMSTNPEGLWYDSSVLQGSNGAVFTFVKDALGATVCNYALAYDAEGVPGKSLWIRCSSLLRSMIFPHRRVPLLPVQ